MAETIPQLRSSDPVSDIVAALQESGVVRVDEMLDAEVLDGTVQIDDLRVSWPARVEIQGLRLIGRDGELGWTTAPRVPIFPFETGREVGGLRKPSCVVGEKLGRQFGISPGDTIQLATLVFPPDSEPKLNNRDFVVSGLFKTEANDVDSKRIYVDRFELADFIGAIRPYSQILVRIEGDDHIGDAVNLASRLCHMAEPQQVLAPASLVSSLMVNTVERPIGDRDVDGFAEPLPVVELLSADRP